jgi:DNA repair protein RadB
MTPELLKKVCENIAGPLSSVITIYGEAATGKTCFCLVSLIETIASGKGVIYIDPQGNFSVERLKQMSGCDEEALKKILSKVIVIRPNDFEYQEKLLNSLRKSISVDVGLVVLDSFSLFYRLEFSKGEKDAYVISRNLGVQLSYLNDISRKHNIPVILTAQTHAKPETGQEASMVGGQVIDHMSKIIIELKRYQNNKRTAVLKKPKSSRKQVEFEIVNEGIKIIK